MSRSAGAAFRAHVETWRPYTLAHPALVGLAGAAADTGGHTSAGLLAAWLCPTLGWLGGHYLGDYFDRDLDAIGKPQRPIPSGRLTPAAARACGIAAVLAAAVVTLAVNWPVVAGVGLASAGIVAYSRLLKGRGILGNAIRGLLTALAVLFGAAVAAPPGQSPSWHVLPVALAFLLHDTASNLVGTLRDVDADREGGYRTVPVVRGLDAATRVSATLYAASLGVTLLYVLAAAHFAAGAVMAVPVVLAGAWAYLPLLRTSCPGARLALRSHEVLVGERLVLAAVVIAGGWGAWPALALLLPVLTVSLLTQRRMRARHEFPPATVVGVTAAPDTGEAAEGAAPREHGPARSGALLGTAPPSSEAAASAPPEVSVRRTADAPGAPVPRTGAPLGAPHPAPPRHSGRPLSRFPQAKG